MNEATEEWKHGEEGIELSLPLARKYLEHETLFLCRIPSFNVVGQSQITHISPSGEHVLITFYGNAYWVKLSDLKVVDVLTPMAKPAADIATRELPVDATSEEYQRLREAYERLQRKFPQGKGKKNEG